MRDFLFITICLLIIALGCKEDSINSEIDMHLISYENRIGIWKDVKSVNFNTIVTVDGVNESDHYGGLPSGIKLFNSYHLLEANNIKYDLYNLKVYHLNPNNGYNDYEDVNSYENIWSLISDYGILNNKEYGQHKDDRMDYSYYSMLNLFKNHSSTQITSNLINNDSSEIFLSDGRCFKWHYNDKGFATDYIHSFFHDSIEKVMKTSITYEYFE